MKYLANSIESVYCSYLNCKMFVVGTVIDAVGLYARYLSLDADEPICIPSEVRNQIEGIKLL